MLPSGRTTRIAAIDTYDGELEEAMAPMSVTMRLEDELDVSRGETDLPPGGGRRRSRASWRPTSAGWPSGRCAPGGRYAIKHTTRNATAVVDEIVRPRRHATRSSARAAPAELELNDIGRVRLRTSAPLVFDPYASNRRTGSFILIDEATNETVGAGMIAATGLSGHCAGEHAPTAGCLSERDRSRSLG